MRLLVLIVVATALAGQSPDCSVIPGSVQQGKERQFDTETLYEYMNGNSEGYFLYGFVRMRGVTCKKGDLSFVVDISEFKTPELAYGMFTSTVDARQPTEKIGAGGQVVNAKGIFVKGAYFGEIAVEPEGPHAPVLRAGLQAMAAKLAGTTDPPAALGWFPKEKLQPGSPRMVPESVLGMRMLRRGYLAVYEQGKAIVVTEDTPEAAAALLGKLKERFEAPVEAKIADGGFSAEDRYLGKVCFFRKGARIAGWSNLAAGQDALAMAGALARAIP